MLEHQLILGFHRLLSEISSQLGPRSQVGVLRLQVLEGVDLLLKVPEIVNSVRVLTLRPLLLLDQNESLRSGDLKNFIVIPEFDLANIDDIGHLVETFARLLRVPAILPLLFPVLLDFFLDHLQVLVLPSLLILLQFLGERGKVQRGYEGFWRLRTQQLLVRVRNEIIIVVTSIYAVASKSVLRTCQLVLVLLEQVPDLVHAIEILHGPRDGEGSELLLLDRLRVQLARADVSSRDRWGLQHLTILEANLAGEARLLHDEFGGLVVEVTEVGVDVLLGQTFLDLGVAFLGVDFLQVGEDIPLANTTCESGNVLDPLLIVYLLPLRRDLLVFVLYDGALVVYGEISEHLDHIDTLKRVLLILGLL